MKTKLRNRYWDSIVFLKSAGAGFQSLTMFCGLLGTLIMVLAVIFLCMRVTVFDLVLFFVATALLLIYVSLACNLYKLRPATQRLRMLYEWLTFCDLYSEDVLEYLLKPKKRIFDFAAKRYSNSRNQNKDISPMFGHIIESILTTAAAAIVKLAIERLAPDTDKSESPAAVLLMVLEIVLVVEIVIMAIVALYTVFVTSSIANVVEQTFQEDINELLIMKRADIDVRKACDAMEHYDEKNESNSAQGHTIRINVKISIPADMDEKSVRSEVEIVKLAEEK